MSDEEPKKKPELQDEEPKKKPELQDQVDKPPKFDEFEDIRKDTEEE